MKTVAVIGASGFIGRHVIATFKNAHSEVLGFTRAADNPGLIQLNYLDTDAVARALNGRDVVVHVAGLAHISSKSMVDPLATFRAANVNVAVSIIDASIRAGVRHFILLSSAGVLGQRSPLGGFDDASPAMPYDAYTTSKFEGEQRVADLARGKIALTILRPPMVYGAGAPGSYQRLCRWIDRGLPLPLGRITALRSYVGIRNLCDLMLTIAASAVEISGESPAMLVADPEPLTVGEFARQIAFVCDQRTILLAPVPRWLLEWTLTAARRQEEYRRLAFPFELRPTRARALFGWRPPYSVREELNWALGNFCISHRAGLRRNAKRR